MSEEKEFKGISVHDDELSREKKIQMLFENEHLYPVLDRNPDLREKVELFLQRPFDDGRYKWKIVQLADHTNEIANRPTRIKFYIRGEYIDVLYISYNHLIIQPSIMVNSFFDSSFMECERILTICAEFWSEDLEGLNWSQRTLTSSSWADIQEMLISEFRQLIHRGVSFEIDDVKFRTLAPTEEPTMHPNRGLNWLPIYNSPREKKVGEIAVYEQTIFIRPNPAMQDLPPQPGYNPMGFPPMGSRPPFGGSFPTPSELGESTARRFGSPQPGPSPGAFGKPSHPGMGGYDPFAMHQPPWSGLAPRRSDSGFPDHGGVVHDHRFEGNSRDTIEFVDWVTVNCTSIDKLIKALAAKNPTFSFRFVAQTQNISEPIQDVCFYSDSNNSNDPIVVCVGKATFYIVVSGWNKGLVKPE